MVPPLLRSLPEMIPVGSTTGYGYNQAPLVPGTGSSGRRAAFLRGLRGSRQAGESRVDSAGGVDVLPPTSQSDDLQPNLDNWIDCIRDRDPMPNGHIYTGFWHSVPPPWPPRRTSKEKNCIGTDRPKRSSTARRHGSVRTGILGLNRFRSGGFPADSFEGYSVTIDYHVLISDFPMCGCPLFIIGPFRCVYFHQRGCACRNAVSDLLSRSRFSSKTFVAEDGERVSISEFY